jgi:hypothetical protein
LPSLSAASLSSLAHTVTQCVFPSRYSFFSRYVYLANQATSSFCVLSPTTANTASQLLSYLKIDEMITLRTLTLELLIDLLMFLDNKFDLVFPLNFHLLLILFNLLTSQFECFLFEPDCLIGRCLQLNLKLFCPLNPPTRFNLQR